jgi:hypothetical protein
MAVPNAGVDGLLLWERHQTTFVNYLRIAFRCAGCPGWDPSVRDERDRPDEPFPAPLAAIAARLLPI